MNNPAECVWCSSVYDPSIHTADFAPSEGYCTTACEQADGDAHEAALYERERSAQAAYALHAFHPDWRRYLPDAYAPDGAARCRNCTALYSADSDSEFCSAQCSDDFSDDYRRWADREDRFTDTFVYNGVADVKEITESAA